MARNNAGNTLRSAIDRPTATIAGSKQVQSEVVCASNVGRCCVIIAAMITSWLPIHRHLRSRDREEAAVLEE